jgi:hypothetical protein
VQLIVKSKRTTNSYSVVNLPGIGKGKNKILKVQLQCKTEEHKEKLKQSAFNAQTDENFGDSRRPRNKNCLLGQHRSN